MKHGRIVTLFCILLFCNMLANAQLWQSTGDGLGRWVRALWTDSTEGKLYAVGSFSMSGDSAMSAIACWDGVQWQGVGGGSVGNLGVIQGNPILSVATMDGNVFVGGMMDMMGGDTSCALLARWDGIRWNSCGHPDSQIYFDVVNGNLFAMGFFDKISNLPIQRFARWNGASWERFADSLPFTSNDGSMSAVEYFQGSYYVGGNFYLDSLKEIMRWDGTAWHDLEGGIFGDAWIEDMQAFRGLLYVGGHFNQASGNVDDFMMAWDGTTWLDAFDKVQFTSQIRRMAVIDDDLYILGGHFYVQADTGWTGPFELARYDGVNFCPFGRTHIEVFEGNEVTDIAKFQGELYFATRLTLAGEYVNYIAKWIGGDSVDICISQPVRAQDPTSEVPNISIHPNPTHSALTLTLESALPTTIQIHDLQGRTLLPTQPYHAGEEIDVSALPAGLYFLEVHQRNVQPQVIKFVKE